MAWKAIPKLKKLVVHFSNGLEDILLENIIGPEMRAVDYTGILANGTGSYDSGNIIANDETEEHAAIYYQLASLSMGSVNFMDYMRLLTANNQYIEIYNPDRASFKIRLTKNSYNWTVTYYAYGYNTGTSYSHSASWSSSWRDVAQNFFFTYDELTGQGNIAWVDRYFRDYPGNIHEVHYRAINGPHPSQICDACITNILLDNIPPEPVPPSTDEPYGDDDYTTSSGGMGPMDDSSDTIEDGVLPLATATMSGMCTVWVPDWGEIQSVANALLSPNIAQILAGNVVKFSDVIIGLSIFPCPIDATNTGTVTANVLGIEIGTGVTCHIADKQYIEIDCGTLDVDEYWCNCLDYNPYTRISIYLPFCGTYELDTDEVMGKTLGVTYRIDIFSGACLATIKIDGSIYYQYAGQCAAQIPISSVSFDNFLSSMLELGVATATGISALGAAGAASEATGHAWTEAKTTRQALKASAEYDLAEENYTKVKESSGSSIADAAVGAVMGSKGFYQHAGAMGGSPGFMGVRKPYLIIKRPEQLIPSMYGKFHGFPCNTTAVLGDLTGYTQVDDIRLNIPEATVDEIIECEQLLKGGVVI